MLPNVTLALKLLSRDQSIQYGFSFLALTQCCFMSWKDTCLPATNTESFALHDLIATTGLADNKAFVSFLAPF